MKLHETIQRVYKKVIKPLIKVEVLSRNGVWNKVESVNVTHEIETIKVITETKQLICAPDHILILASGNEILAKDCCGKKIQTADGLEIVISVEETGVKQALYDLSLAKQSLAEDDEDHLYFTNDILSHNCIICDEFAFLKRSIADKLFTSMYPTISSSKSGKFIIVSTPNGTDNLYYDIWMQANAKDQSKNLDGWKPFTMWWYQVPGHDELWKKKQIAAIGEKRFAQEFNNEFLAGGDSRTLLPSDIIDRYRIQMQKYKEAHVISKKQKIVSQDQREMFEFEMWHEFKPERTYAASMDIAEGVGTDASVLYIWDVTDLSNIVMCAAFSSNRISLVEFAYVASKMLALYGNPPLAAERNGVSAGTIDSLKITYGYTNIIVDNKKGEAGIFSHVTVKERACQWCREMASTQGFGFTIYDKALVDEMSTFVKKDSKGQRAIYAALEGKDSHDDHMMAFVWLTYILQNDMVEKNFIVCQTFTTEFGKIFPRVLQPMNAYTGDMWRSISNDPLYQEFVKYREEGQMKAAQMKALEEESEKRDIFKYNVQSQHDIYFDDDDGPMWNDRGGWGGSSWQPYASAKPPVLNPNAQMPSFYII